MNINPYFATLPDAYLFVQIEREKLKYLSQHPEQKLINMGVGDVTRPLPKVITDAMHRAVDELGRLDTFRGYGPEEGYSFLRQSIIDNKYRQLGIDLCLEEVFIGEGAGSDLGNLSELFTSNNRVAVLDPVYPAYVDTSVIAGRAGQLNCNKWSNIIYLPCTAANDFVPELPNEHADIIYLCFPNNPTGTVLKKQELKQWVDYAIRHKSIIIYDAAYEAFICEDDVPHSIYEIEGAKEVAIEVCSFSKNAGFTSVRCGYTIVPKQTGLQNMWYRRQCTKYNGTSYIAQRAAEATLTQEGKEALKNNLQYYKTNASIILNSMTEAGYHFFGGINSPYIWVKTPKGIDSWQFFHILLEQCRIVCSPGCGFGQAGEGYVRFTAFGSHDDTLTAMKAIKTL